MVQRKPRIDLVLINWNGAEDAPVVLDSIRRQTLAPERVTVVDNGSRDSSREWFQAQPGVELLANQSNRGFAVAANQGIRAGSSPLVCLCNLDVSLSPEFLASAARRMESLPRIGTVGGRLLGGAPGPGPARLDSTGHVLHRSGWVANRGQGELDQGQYQEAEEVFGASAAAILYRREMLEDVALSGEIFCESFFAYLEDVDLDWRARWRAWRCWYEPEAVAWHRRGGTGLHRTAAIERHVVANRISLWRRNAPQSWRDGPGAVSATAFIGLRLGLAAYRHPSALGGLLDSWRSIRRDLRARRQIQGSRRVSDRAISSWAQPTPWSRLLLRGRGRGS